MAKFHKALRWDLAHQLHLDLNDWLRGERNWQDLWDLKEGFSTGSHYNSAKLKDPEIVEYLASLPHQEEITPPPLEGYDSVQHALADVVDRLTQMLYGAEHAHRAPLVKRPEFPHMVARQARKSKQLNRLTANFD